MEIGSPVNAHLRVNLGAALIGMQRILPALLIAVAGLRLTKVKASVCYCTMGRRATLLLLTLAALLLICIPTFAQTEPAGELIAQFITITGVKLCHAVDVIL